MKIIYTDNNPETTFSLYDTESKLLKDIPFEEGQENTNCDNTRKKHRPFGITWDADNIYIASRKSLLVYDSDLKWVDKIEILDENTHQITMHEDKILACMTRKDCIAKIDLQSGDYIEYHPDEGWGKYPTLEYPRYDVWGENNVEKYHINSVLSCLGNIYFLKQRPCELVKIDKQGELTVTSLTGGGFPRIPLFHGIIIKAEAMNEDNPLKYIKTIKQNGMQRYFDGTRKPCANANFLDGYKAFYRGAAGVFDDTLYGYSVHEKFIDGRSVETSGLSNGDNFNGASINDMRRIDGQDDAHHNPHPFPYAWE